MTGVTYSGILASTLALTPNHSDVTVVPSKEIFVSDVKRSITLDISFEIFL